MASSSAPAWPTLRALHAFQDDADDDLVGHQVAVVHVLLGLLAELGPVLDRLAQDVSGGDVGQLEVLLQALGLSSLARARRAKKDEIELGHGEDRRVRVDFRTAQEA